MKCCDDDDALSFLLIVQYNVIILDVDNKDASSGLSSPPLPFTTPQFLQAVKSLLHLDGKYTLLILIVCCYNNHLQAFLLPTWLQGIKTLKNLF